jgi:predicted small secreted protein
MKKNVIKLVTVLFIASTILIGCNTPAAKVEDAKENVDETKEDLDQAHQEYLAEVENYRSETSGKITENEKIIADFIVMHALLSNDIIHEVILHVLPSYENQQIHGKYFPFFDSLPSEDDVLLLFDFFGNL